MNRHGGVSLASIQGVKLHPGGAAFNRVEPCPVASFSGAAGARFIVTSAIAYVSGGSALYTADNTPVLDIYGGQHTTIAYSDSECLKKPCVPLSSPSLGFAADAARRCFGRRWNPSQPTVFGIFVASMALTTAINCVPISVMNNIYKLNSAS